MICIWMWHRFWNFINKNKSIFWLISSQSLSTASNCPLRSFVAVWECVVPWTGPGFWNLCHAFCTGGWNVKTFHKHLHKQEPVYKMTPKAISLSASICLSIFQVLRSHSSFSSPCFPGHPAWAEKSHSDSHKTDCSPSTPRELGKPLSYSPYSSLLLQPLWIRSPAALGPYSAPSSLR